MKPTKIKIGGKNYQFIYNLKALRQLELAIGEPLFTAFADESKMASIDMMCKFIWAGMLEYEEKTLEEVESMITPSDLAVIMAECGQLLGSAMSGEPEKKMQVSKVS